MSCHWLFDKIIYDIDNFFFFDDESFDERHLESAWNCNSTYSTRTFQWINNEIIEYIISHGRILSNIMECLDDWRSG